MKFGKVCDSEYYPIGIGLAIFGAAIAAVMCLVTGHELYAIIFMIGGGCAFDSLKGGAW